MIVRTYSYKGIGLHEIRADVYRPDADSCAPVVLWLHGGGPIFGSRKDFGNLWAAHLQRYLAAGFVVVAVDYRLAPETKLDAIVEDVRDAHRWIRDVGPPLFGIDAGRIALVGHSAGGFLALTAGWMLRPRPTALISFYGYADVTRSGTRDSLPTTHRNQRYPETRRSRRSGALQSLNRWRRICAPGSISIADKTASGRPK